jgi:sugar lactone lactonase YvrE
MAGFEVRHVLDVKALLGEAPIWSAEQDALIWLDIRRDTLNRFDPTTGANKSWALPVRHPGAFTLCTGGVAIATSQGFFRFDFASETFDRLGDVPIDPEIYRFNDGKADRQGRFWIGSMLIAFTYEGPGEGTYFRYEDGKWEAGIQSIKVPNGTAFSPDGTVMYRSESMSRQMFAYDYDPATGTASNERIFAEMPDGFGIPDGGTVDSEGCVWSAIPFGDGGRVARFKPDGKLDLCIEVPVTVPTMVAFGGKDLSTLYVTSGRIEDSLGLPFSTLGGDIFAIDTPFRGIPEALTRV